MIIRQSNRHEDSIKALDTKFTNKIDALDTKFADRTDALAAASPRFASGWGGWRVEAGDMVTEDHVQVRVTGTLTCIDEDGARPLTADEFHDVMDRIAEHLDNEAEVTDPGTWGQASTGNMEIHFILADPVAGPELNQRVGSIIRRMGEDVDLIWPTEPSTATRSVSGTVLAQTRQICELAAA